MKRAHKYTLLIVVVVIVIVGVAAIASALLSRAHRNDAAAKAQAAANQAAAVPRPASCFAANESLAVTDDQRSQVELAAMSQLRTVPAGTHVDVSITSYSAATASGSILYPGKYGNYNFVLTKSASATVSQPNWHIEAFVACKK